MRDSLGLATFFRVNAGIGAVGIHKSENRAPEFFCDLHDAQRLAVAFGMRRAEVAIDALLHVAAFLRTDDEDFFAVKTSHSANNGGIVSEGAVAMDFAKVGEQAVDVIESLRTLRMAGQFGYLPGGLRTLHLFP